MPYVNYKRVTKITLEEISEFLATDDRWLERAIVVLHDRQTEVERRVRETFNKNDLGLQVADARDFSRFAEQIKREVAAGKALGTCLTESQKRHARRPWHRSKVPQPTICKYRRQILDIIEASAKAKLISARA